MISVYSTKSLQFARCWHRRLRQLLLTLAAPLLLLACASPSVQYYSLQGAQPMLPQPFADQSPSTATVASVTAPDTSDARMPSTHRETLGLQLRVQHMPAETERPQLLVRDPAHDPAVYVLNESMWAAPLDEQVQTLLSAEVSALLGIPEISRLSAAADLAQRRIDVRIETLELVWEQGAAVNASWADQASGQEKARLCSARIQVPADADGSLAELVQAQRRALQQLAALIARGDAESSQNPGLSGAGKATVLAFACA